MTDNQVNTLKKQDFYIVGIGSSAGGTAAFNEILSRLPTTINASFIIIQHLHPEFETKNYQLAANYTQLKTFKAEHDQLIAPGCVYFLPENVMMTIKNGRLQLRSRRKDEVINRAIDIFFTSLALDAQDKAMGIILSGYGKDGVTGSIEIDKAGGIVMCQSPRFALYKGMPQSLISRHKPSFILPPDELALMILKVTGLREP